MKAGGYHGQQYNPASPFLEAERGDPHMNTAKSVPVQSDHEKQSSAERSRDKGLLNPDISRIGGEVRLCTQLQACACTCDLHVNIPEGVDSAIV